MAGLGDGTIKFWDLETVLAGGRSEKLERVGLYKSLTKSRVESRIFI